MEFTQKLTNYFRQSLIDGERLCPADKDLLPVLGVGKPTKASSAYVAQPCTVWSEGRISSDLAQKIFEKQQKPKSPRLLELEIILLPRADLYISQGGWSTSLNRKILTPLCVFVRLQRDGSLLPGGTAPWIPREWLSPNASATQPFAEFSNVDNFLTLNPYQGIKSWPDLTVYCESLLAAAVGFEISSEEPASNSTLYAIPLHSEYRVAEQCLLQIEPPLIGAKVKIIKVLEALLARKQFPPLYERFTSPVDQSIVPHETLVHDIAMEKLHIAQMTGEFALSDHQRNGLHYFLQQNNGEILAINGPPGTGKTTLLRSVVANLWTSAALNESMPPLIVAASNNNQAVTNILESFSKVDEHGLDESLKGRWLPDVDSYGLYCCSTSKSRDTPYLHMDAGGEGSIKKFQSQTYVDAASRHYLQRASIWSGSNIERIEDARSLLHGKLESLCDEIADALVIKEKYLIAQSQLRAIAQSPEELVSAILDQRSQTEKANVQLEQTQSRFDMICQLWERRSIWIHLLFWLPTIRKLEFRKTERLISQWSDDIPLKDFTDDEVESFYRARIAEIRQRLTLIKNRINYLDEVLTNYLASKDALENFIKRHRPAKLLTKELASQCSEVIDRTLRFHSFKIATHYWEARWLEEVKEFLLKPNEHEKSPTTMPRRYRRHAKLTPCFVSTFYTLPAVFTAYRGEEKPLFDEIDLLIVDEAGQALAEVSAVSFALARKALIVGDTDQIEPVWGIPEKIDLANLAQYELLEHKDYDDFWKRSGLLASSGNVMRVAQRQSKYHQYETLSRGLYLTEHRRCYDNIIGYCNTLVYKGVLKPLRGQPKVPTPWGTMSFYEVFSPSQSMGGSRVNFGEAEAIVNWLCHNRQSILKYARHQDEKLIHVDETEALKRAVGIVTPFSRQANTIKSLLYKRGIKDLTVGTVHRLQGDERLLILFSSVYGGNDKASGKFYDYGSNMLNVAVSRAKDSFIVFGHPDVFGVGAADSPSGLLRRELSTVKEVEVVHQ